MEQNNTPPLRKKKKKTSISHHCIIAVSKNVYGFRSPPSGPKLTWRDQELQWGLPACSSESANGWQSVTLLQGKGARRREHCQGFTLETGLFWGPGDSGERALERHTCLQTPAPLLTSWASLGRPLAGAPGRVSKTGIGQLAPRLVVRIMLDNAAEVLTQSLAKMATKLFPCMVCGIYLTVNRFYPI